MHDPDVQWTLEGREEVEIGKEKTYVQIILFLP